MLPRAVGGDDCALPATTGKRGNGHPPKNFFDFVPCCAAQLQRRHVSTLKTRGAGKTTLKIARIARKNAFTSTDVQLASGGGRRGNKKLQLQLLQSLLRHQYSKNCRMAIPSSKVRRCLLSESAAEVEWGTARGPHDDPDSGTDSPSHCEVATRPGKRTSLGNVTVPVERHCSA